MSGSVVILAPWECKKQNGKLTNELWRLAREHVERINGAARRDMLYLTECAGVWFLYGKVRKNDVDKLLLHGFCDVEDLARLVIKMQNAECEMQNEEARK